MTYPSSDQNGHPPEPQEKDENPPESIVKVTSPPNLDEKIISVRLTSRMEAALKPEEIADHIIEKMANDYLATHGDEIYQQLQRHRGDTVDRVMEKVAFALSTRLLQALGAK